VNTGTSCVKNQSKRVFPTYLQTGGNYLIEKSKRVMIAEDLKEAFEIITK